MPALGTFCTHNIWPPLEILDYFLHVHQFEGIKIYTICINEDGAQAHRSKFTDFLLLCHITLDTIGGYHSWLHVIMKCPNHTVANKARALLINSNHTSDKWCFVLWKLLLRLLAWLLIQPFISPLMKFGMGSRLPSMICISRVALFMLRTMASLLALLNLGS